MGSCYSHSAFQRNDPNGECSGQGKHGNCHRMLEALVSMKTYNRNLAAEKYVAVFDHTLRYKDVLQSGSVFDKLILKSLKLPIHERTTPDGPTEVRELEWGSDEDYLLPVNSEHPISSAITLETCATLLYGTQGIKPSQTMSLEIVIVQTSSCHAGYCRLGLRETDSVTGLPKTDSVHLLKNDCLLHNKIVKQYCNVSPNDLKAAIRLKLELRPRFLTAFQTDLVLCFEYRGWPKGTRGIFKRPHKSGWPSDNLVSKLKLLNILIVRKPHPSSEKSENEFRLSFSLPEAVLCWSIPDEVRHPFCTCKLLVGITNYDKRMSCYLSYHLKTVLLWSMEQKTTQEFKEMGLKCGVLFFISELVEAYENKELKHFFIPENNMIDHVLDTDLQKTISVLHDLNNSICGLALYFHLHCSPLANCATIRKQFESYRAYTAGKESLVRVIEAKHFNTREEVQRRASEAHVHFQRALKLQPSWTAISLDIGQVHWCAGNKVGAMVLWLNAAVISEQLNTNGESGEDIIHYFERKHCSLDLALQFQLRCVQESDQYGFSLRIMQNFLLIKYSLLPPSSAEYLTLKIEQALESLKIGQFYPGSMKIGYYLLACCFKIIGKHQQAAKYLLDALEAQSSWETTDSNPKQTHSNETRIDITRKLLFVPHDFEETRCRLALYRELENEKLTSATEKLRSKTEKLRSETEKLRSDTDLTMYDVIAPIAEYVRCHRDNFRRNRRHSFSVSSPIMAISPKASGVSFRKRRHSLSEVNQLQTSPRPSPYRDVIREMYTAPNDRESSHMHRCEWARAYQCDDMPVVSGIADLGRPYAAASDEEEEIKVLAQDMQDRGLRCCSVM